MNGEVLLFQFLKVGEAFWFDVVLHAGFPLTDQFLVVRHQTLFFHTI